MGHTGENVQLIEDAVGLKITAKIEKSNPNYEEILNNISFNRLTGFSFGFIPLKQNWEDDKHVTVEDMKLLEVSLLNVTPAYNGTVVETRDKDNNNQIHLRYGEGVDEMEELLKELIAEVKSLKEAILEDKEPKENKEEKKEDKTEDETEDKVDKAKENEEVKAKEEPKEDEEKENKEDDKEDEEKEEPVENKEDDKEDDKEDKKQDEEDEEKKRALLIQSQLDSLR